MPLNPKKPMIELAKEMMAAGHSKDQSFAAAFAAKGMTRKKAKKKGKK